ncbi:tRNA 2-selenouridine synthase [Fibrella aestuarina BUZ 2]|uniref:tRNA 2-selenouridine synthase n=1 Tax=Fibrella aestuarina BUZ 2 TaxID=1166018 RepID=I0K4Y0_9BACT|nr:tRNA 2-selenouridine(34) synthase MnmH [Fibrella aestuarina]CCG99183.1 tRNA 2-selenouridine synthase [Fibrella aestuarina BUZ 2]
MPLAVDDFLNQGQTLPVLDVRSPGEFAHAHIPGAVNMPLFDNAERAEIGTIYKQVGRDAAVLRGLELVGPKMADFVRQAQALNPAGREVLVHCWRGGMRSGSMAWLLNTAGIRAQTLEGGYKAYRNTVLTGLAQPRQVLVLGGKTGSGKTDVLKQLAALGEQVIDLEGLAHHKGSSYGAIGQLPQPSTEQYENRVFDHYRHLDPTKRVWIEDESRSVGKCFVPMSLWQQMQTAPVAFIDVPRAVRVERLVREYTGIDHTLLVEATERIRKRLGGQAYKDAIDALNRGDYATVADLTLNYYDKAYLHSLNQRDKSSVSPIPIATDDPTQTAQKLIAWADANVPNGVFP